MANEINILLTTMSTLNRDDKTGTCRENKYFAKDAQGNKHYCSGKCTMEAGSKYLLHKYSIDRIVAVGTKETIMRSDTIEMEINPDKGYEVSDLECELNRLSELAGVEENPEKNLSAFEFYEYQIINFLINGEKCEENHKLTNEKNKPNKSKKITIQFVPERVKIGKGDIDNVSGIVDALLGRDDQNINLYIDIQGGNRTSGFVRNAILAVLNSQYPDRIKIREMVAINYDRAKKESEIVSEYDSYRILDLVSGMNAFVQYGKADMIKKYCDDLNISKQSVVAKLVKSMVDIDGAISLCDTKGLIEAIKELKTALACKTDSDNDSVNNIFTILKKGIEEDYGKLVTQGEPDSMELISWCLKKGFIQQALTLIEDKMPGAYIGEEGSGRIITYEFNNGDNKNQFLKFFGHSWDENENKIFYTLDFERSDSADSKGLTDDDCDKYYGELERLIGTNDGQLEVLRSKCKYYDRNEHIWKHKDGLKHSILKCVDEAIPCSVVNSRTHQTITATITVRTDDSTDREKLKRLFYLHKLLKQERNDCNHASKQNARFSVDAIKVMIGFYLEKAKEVL